MNEKSLEKNLANMERELINLQTAHDVGLGSVIYWEYSSTIRAFYESGWEHFFICLEVAQGERLNPIMMPYCEAYGITETLKSETYPDRYLIAASGFLDTTIDYKWKVVSTSKMNYHYATSIQEAKDWIDWQM